MKRFFLVNLSVIALMSACTTGNVDERTDETEDVEVIQEIEEAEVDVEPETPINDEPVVEKELDTVLTVLAEDLNIPWSINKVEDVFYISERVGTIAKVENGEVTQQSVQLKHEVSTEAEAGLLGFVLDPNFMENQMGYAYYTYEGENGPTNRIVQLTLSEDEWEETTILLDGIPSGAFHHGGRLAIGPDDKIYATTGDALVPEMSQDLDSLAGNILRLEMDGSIPEDNPFDDSYIYSYGHRNAQGFAWNADGKMYASEHGNQANDEVNEIVAGGNYGWPVIEGDQRNSDMHSPIFTSGTQETWAPSGMDEYNGRLFVSALRGNAVLEFNLDDHEVNTHLTGYGRIRDVFIEDGFLYFITNNRDGRGDPVDADDQLIRIGIEELY